MSNWSASSLFSMIINFIVGSSNTHDPADHHDMKVDTPHVAHDHDHIDSKLKLVSSHSIDTIADVAGKVPSGSAMTTGLGALSNDHSTDSPFLHKDSEEVSFNPAHDHTATAANQNAMSFMDHLPVFNEARLTDFSTSNDDVVNTSIGLVTDNTQDIGRILSADTIPTFDTLDYSVVANDAGHSVELDASDILSMGNNLIITGNELDSVNFQDEGWSRIDFADSHPQGIEPREGFDTFMHDSGAIVQIEAVIHTNFDNPHGLY